MVQFKSRSQYKKVLQQFHLILPLRLLRFPLGVARKRALSQWEGSGGGCERFQILDIFKHTHGHGRYFLFALLIRELGHFLILLDSSKFGRADKWTCFITVTRWATKFRPRLSCSISLCREMQDDRRSVFILRFVSISSRSSFSSSLSLIVLLYRSLDIETYRCKYWFPHQGREATIQKN